MYNILVLYGVLLCDLSKYFAQKLLFVLLPYYYYDNIHGLYSFCSIRIMKFTLKEISYVCIFQNIAGIYLEIIEIIILIGFFKLYSAEKIPYLVHRYLI